VEHGGFTERLYAGGVDKGSRTGLTSLTNRTGRTLSPNACLPPVRQGMRLRTPQGTAAGSQSGLLRLPGLQRHAPR